ncbi:putative serine esterase (DUF676) [Trypanosoma vivax]|uniref:DUF676 domain-containing protein n=1 Tax=Trypanosoma vivax (strain Y486) TaxID=1055687 RepID=G0UD79_TRYVY|nr:hypothetical protein TRVL_07200 [Trypanosoma vivax]KAH8609048.1 putative serine esterase (DUF676) [Trypanosoma vivax]CCC53790.1 conserved hypothetical protein [Trypanosoma vivax Y486]
MTEGVNAAQERHRVVVLHHGSHGTFADFKYLAEYLKLSRGAPIVWEPTVNETFRTDDGVLPCGIRLKDDLMRMLGQLCALSTKEKFGAVRPYAKTVVEMSFVCHSMGGLIVREALPHLFDEIQRLDGHLQVKWKLFCCICTPHGGTSHMPSTLRRYVGRLIGRLYSTSYHDMFLQSNVLTEHLLSGKHLACLAAFERRLLISSINDILVPLPSSGFLLSPSERQLTGPAAQQAERDLCACSEEEMRTKIQRLTNLDPSNWPVDMFQAERRIAETLLQGAGAFDSIVVDLRPSTATAPREKASLAQYGACDKSHQALICMPPFESLHDTFGFVLRMVAEDLLERS